MYKDRDRQREAQKERTRRYRAKQKGVTLEGVTMQGVTQSITNITQADVPKTLTDRELLESWARGEGSEYQRRMGVLAAHYRRDRPDVPCNGLNQVRA